MVFTRFVEVGRVGYVNYGDLVGKPIIITDVVDQSRVLVCNPHPKYNIPQQVIALKRITLTTFKVDIPRAIGYHALGKKIVALDSTEHKLFGNGGKWESSPWQKKLNVRAKRSALSDFDRFKVMVAKKQRRELIFREVNKLKKTAAK